MPQPLHMNLFAMPLYTPPSDYNDFFYDILRYTTSLIEHNITEAEKNRLLNQLQELRSHTHQIAQDSREMCIEAWDSVIGCLCSFCKQSANSEQSTHQLEIQEMICSSYEAHKRTFQSLTYNDSLAELHLNYIDCLCNLHRHVEAIEECRALLEILHGHTNIHPELINLIEVHVQAYIIRENQLLGLGN